MIRRNHHPQHEPSHKPSWRFNTLFIVLTALITGLLIDVLLYRVIGLERILSTFEVLVIATLFTVVFTGSLRLADRVLRTGLPLNSFRNLWVYIALNSLVAILAFFAGARLNELLFPQLDIIDFQSAAFLVVAGVSLLACIFGIIIYFSHDFYHRLKTAESKRHESQLAALMAQINPHFLFNSLNSIASLIRVDPKKAEHVTEELAELFRYTLQSSKKEKVTLKEELDAVQSYLSIEKARFGEQLQFTSDVDERLLNSSLPGFTFQPLVENCVKHAVSQTLTPLHIHLKAQKQGSLLKLEVTDSGPGFDDEPENKILQRGTGLANIKERLALHYGERATLALNGQTVTLKIPV